MSDPNSLPALAGPLPSDHVRQQIPAGQRGTAKTIRDMQDLVSLGLRDGRIRPIVGAAIAGCPQKDYACYAQSIYSWMIENIKYVWDPNGVELLEHPYYVLAVSRVGDCDSMAVAIATLYEQIDLPARFVTVKADPNFPNEFSHVYVEVKVPGKGWTGADVTMPGKFFGWKPPERFPRKYWPATRERTSDSRDDKLEGFRPMNDLNGLNAMDDWLVNSQPMIPAPVMSPQLSDWLRNSQPMIPAPVASPFLGAMPSEPMPAILLGALAGAMLSSLVLKKKAWQGAIAGAGAGYLFSKMG